MVAKNDIFEKRIAISEMTFADWQAIGDAIGNNQSWAYYRWAEVSSPDLSQLSIEDWEAIENACEFKEGWAYHRLREWRG